MTAASPLIQEYNLTVWQAGVILLAFLLNIKQFLKPEPYTNEPYPITEAELREREERERRAKEERLKAEFTAFVERMRQKPPNT